MAYTYKATPAIAHKRNHDLPTPLPSLQQSYISFASLSSSCTNTRATTELWLPRSSLIRARSVAELSKAVVAVKRANDARGAKQLATEIEALDLIRRHRDCKHASAAHVFEVMDRDGRNGWWLATKFLSGGTLGCFLKNRLSEAANPTLMWHVTKQVLQALQFLHGHTGQRDRTRPVVITHNDLHCENVCFDLSAPREFAGVPNIRLIDFGMSCATKPGQVLQTDPRRFPAPSRMAVEPVVDIAYKEDVIWDLECFREIVHWLAHPPGHDRAGRIPHDPAQGLRNGECLLCREKANGGEVDFTVDDEDYTLMMNELPPPRSKRPVPERELYTVLIEVADRRRAWAAAYAQRSDAPLHVQIPEIISGINLDAKTKQTIGDLIFDADMVEDTATWIDKWRGILKRENEKPEPNTNSGELSHAICGSSPCEDHDGFEIDSEGDVIMRY